MPQFPIRARLVASSQHFGAKDWRERYLYKAFLRETVSLREEVFGWGSTQ